MDNVCVWYIYGYANEYERASSDPYEILQIEAEASQLAIENAYRKLYHIYHPDTPTGNMKSFRKITKAYQVSNILFG